ncbi:MAG: hypothetical protein JSV65_11140 [Armatimonadota bacterium]|nr:MAG: hypothetical protein JSV65_11140 [Armatimonadota bacterium]
MSPNGRYILAGGALTGYGWLGIYDAVSRRLTVRLRPRHLVDHFAAYEWLADSRTVLLSCDTEKYDWQSHRGPGGIWKWDIISGAAKEWLETGTPISCVEVSPDASRIAYLVPAEDSSLSKLRVHEIVSGSTSTVWQGIHYAHLGDFSWAPDSKRIALSEDTWEDGAAALWVIDVVERTQRIILENATAPAWSPR